MTKFKNYLTIRALQATNRLAQEVKKLTHDQTGGGDIHIEKIGYVVAAAIAIFLIIEFIPGLGERLLNTVSDIFDKIFGKLTV